MNANQDTFKIKWTFYLLLVVLLTFSACESSQTIELYVSVEGNDGAGGSITEPFATILKAVDAVHKLRKNGNSNPAIVFLRDGRHQLTQTLVLGIVDGSPAPSELIPLEKYGAGQSGDQAYITFAAFPGKHPVVSSGIPLTRWKLLETPPSELPEKVAGKVCGADIPEGLDRFYTLYDSTGRLNRARDAGFSPVQPGGHRTSNFPSGSLKNWDNISDVEIQIRPSRAWVVNMLPLAYVDESAGIAKTSVSATYIQYPVNGAKVYHNIIISNPEGGVAHGEIAKSQSGAYRPNIEETEMDSNLYYHSTNHTWVDEHLKRMRAIGKEKASLLADPMFKDPANGDFGFKEGSPALALGIEELDVSKMGLLVK